ncbi:glycosyltransferase [Denitromonas iodatirespirans]|uniref:Glycosyltransferase family 1 protein n=1 Tax=Denitromonas iodatirespirans TaxID=2795389 RepID=A0A944DCA4_DENI1|nr:glycosyltransferase [Denitromonas iodatirespirans]MBT0962817.1 glycosyltransferase family 1 protein [Denitromonas iodatirespirans]
MNIFIATYGSRGDVQPYIALGKGLQAAGHEVTLATSERFREEVEAHGLHFGYMNDTMLAILDTDQGREMLENTRSAFAVVKRTFSMMKQVGPLQRRLLQEGWDAARQCQPDLIIFHPKAYGGPLYAEKLGVPVILALVIPMLVPTAEHPHLGFPDLKLGAAYNRMTHALVKRLMGLSAGKPVKAWRAANGLPRQGRFDVLHTHAGKAIPVLCGFSRHVVPPPTDWPETVTTTGYWFLDGHDHWTPPPALADFLAAGPPPVYVGFGSMAGRDPQRLGRIVIDALQHAGVRGIVATGWGGLQIDAPLPDSILRIEQAPHDWLFPRMATVVHHGGAGTTAAALRAGKPSVIVPFFGDQPYWARRVHALGAGSRPLPQKTLTVEALAAAINGVDAGVREKAAALGAAIRNEDGIGNAVAQIEKLMGGA